MALRVEGDRAGRAGVAHVIEEQQFHGRAVLREHGEIRPAGADGRPQRVGTPSGQIVVHGDHLIGSARASGGKLVIHRLSGQVCLPVAQVPVPCRLPVPLYSRNPADDLQAVAHYGLVDELAPTNRGSSGQRKAASPVRVLRTGSFQKVNQGRRRPGPRQAVGEPAVRLVGSECSPESIQLFRSRGQADLSRKTLSG